MKVKATNQIIDWDADAGQMVVINAGDVGTLNETMRAKHEGSWEPHGDDDLEDEDEGSAPDNDVPDIDALRQRIAELEGENAEVATLRTRVTELETERDELLAELEEADKQIAELTPAENAADADQTGDDLGALREEYEKLAGKKVFNGWDAQTVRAKIAELKADADKTGDEGDAPPA